MLVIPDVSMSLCLLTCWFWAEIVVNAILDIFPLDVIRECLAEVVEP